MKPLTITIRTIVSINTASSSSTTRAGSLVTGDRLFLRPSTTTTVSVVISGLAIGLATLTVLVALGQELDQIGGRGLFAGVDLGSPVLGQLDPECFQLGR